MLLGDLRGNFQTSSFIGRWDVCLRLDDGSRMSREAHVRFCEGPWVQSPRSTHPYIRTHEGWLFLAVVLDLFSRQVVGWSMGPRMDRELALNALLMAVWKRQPKQTVMVHSDQGSQFSSYDWQDFLKTHKLQQSMSRRGNCHDNAVAESFFQLLKRERIRRKTYETREDARRDIFDYIEMFYNPKRRHSFSKQLSPMNYEKQYFQQLASV